MNSQTTTNSLRIKAEELIAMSADCGIEAKITWESGLAIYISYTNSVYSVIGHTPTGKVSVKSYERWGRRTESVSMKNLPGYLAFHAGRMTKVA